MAGLGWPCTNLRLLTCFIGSLEMPLAELLPIIALGYTVLNSPITQEDTGTASLSSDPRSWSSRFTSPPRFGPEGLYVWRGQGITTSAPDVFASSLLATLRWVRKGSCPFFLCDRSCPYALLPSGGHMHLDPALGSQQQTNCSERKLVS